jgi:hypothetical protein
LGLLVLSQSLSAGEFGNIIDLRLSRAQRCAEALKETKGADPAVENASGHIGRLQMLRPGFLSSVDLPSVVDLTPVLKDLGLDEGPSEKIPAASFPGFENPQKDEADTQDPKDHEPEVAIIPLYPLRALAAMARPEYFAAKPNRDNRYDSPMLWAILRSMVIFQVTPEGIARIVTRLDAPRLVDSLENPEFILNTRILRVSVHERGAAVARWLFSDHLLNVALKPAHDVFFYNLAAHGPLLEAPTKLSQLMGAALYRVRQLSPLTYVAITKEDPQLAWFVFYNPVNDLFYKLSMPVDGALAKLLLRPNRRERSINMEMTSADGGLLSLPNGDLLKFDRFGLIVESVRLGDNKRQTVPLPDGYSYVRTQRPELVEVIDPKDPERKKTQTRFDIKFLNPAGTPIWSQEGVSRIYGVRGDLHRFFVQRESTLTLFEVAGHGRPQSWTIPESFQARPVLTPVHGGYIASIQESNGFESQFFLTSIQLTGTVSEKPLAYWQVTPRYLMGASPVDSEHRIRLHLAPLPDEDPD